MKFDENYHPLKVIIESKGHWNQPFPGMRYHFIFIGLDPILESIHFTSHESVESIEQAINKISFNEEFIYYKSDHIFKHGFQIDNFLWHCKISNYESCKVENINLFYFRNKTSFDINTINNTYKFDNDIPYYVNKHNTRAVIMPHWGWTDVMIECGLVRYYKHQFPNLLIICYSHQEAFFKSLFPDINIRVISFDEGGKKELKNLIVKLFNEDVIFICDGHQTTQNFTDSCLQLNLSSKTNIQQINLDSFKKTEHNYNILVKHLDKSNPTFEERISFYTLSKIHPNVLFDFFKIIRNSNKESSKYSVVVGNLEKYIVEHTIQGMNVDSTYKKISLNNHSQDIIDILKVIENSEEIHIYDSVYGVLVYLLYFSSDFYKGKKIYYHRYARKKIPKFFDLEKMKNSGDWIILE